MVRYIELTTIKVIAAGAAGTAALAAYLNAKFHIAYDLQHARGGLAPSQDVVDFVTDRVVKKRVLTYHILEDQALRNRPNHPFLIFEGKTWTYKQFFDAITRVGNWLMNDLGVQVGEMVAIDGGNSPEYLMLWFALDAIGACMSYINWNLTGAGLVHCAKVGRSCCGMQLVANASSSCARRSTSLRTSTSRAMSKPVELSFRISA